MLKIDTSTSIHDFIYFFIIFIFHEDFTACPWWSLFERNTFRRLFEEMWSFHDLVIRTADKTKMICYMTTDGTFIALSRSKYCVMVLLGWNVKIIPTLTGLSLSVLRTLVNFSIGRSKYLIKPNMDTTQSFFHNFMIIKSL